MPREPRILPDSCMLHIICRGNNSIRLFRNKQDFTKFYKTLFRYTNKSDLFIHNYILMKTHIHLLAWIENTNSISKIIKSMLISYHHYYRRKYKYKGHLWHGRFRSIIIKSDEHWLQCGRYIELNPVHARICNTPDAHPWSSYHYYAHGKKDNLLRPNMYVDDTSIHTANSPNITYQEFVYAGIDIDYNQQKKRYEKQ